jgi:prolyl oligopeptidase
VEAGGVFVTVNLRGGGEYGDDWHRAGVRDRKQKVFDDFLAAAQALIDGGWTTPSQLGLCGESNGGLLVGAAITQRPDLFAAAVCSAPVLDMVRYERSGLGRAWVQEYGIGLGPGATGEPAGLLAVPPGGRRGGLSSRPVHRLRRRHPGRPLHARKMCAALQHATTGPRPVLLRLDHAAGHSVAAVSGGVGLAADMLAFLATHTGLTS